MTGLFLEYGNARRAISRNGLGRQPHLAPPVAALLTLSNRRNVSRHRLTPRGRLLGRDHPPFSKPVITLARTSSPTSSPLLPAAVSSARSCPRFSLTGLLEPMISRTAGLDAYWEMIARAASSPTTCLAWRTCETLPPP